MVGGILARDQALANPIHDPRKRKRKRAHALDERASYLGILTELNCHCIYTFLIVFQGQFF